MVELGGYIGYSALLFGNAVQKAGGHRYWSLEKSPLFAAVARSLVDLAGLAEVVRIEVGASGESIERLHRQGMLGKVEMMFLDHHKPSYTADLKLAEGLGIVGQGTTLVADNVILPGNPPYLEYVRSTVEEKREKAGKGNADGAGGRGNPDLRYQSRMVKCFEPSGMEVNNTRTPCFEGFTLTWNRMPWRLQSVLEFRDRRRLLDTDAKLSIVDFIS
jgi:catechol O-methyltransferase